MIYPIAIERGSDKHAYGVVVPDLPGCFAAGDTLEDAAFGAWEAIVLYLDGGVTAPEPTEIEVLKLDPRFQGWDWAYVEVDPSDFAQGRL